MIKKIVTQILFLFMTFTVNAQNININDQNIYAGVDYGIGFTNHNLEITNISMTIGRQETDTTKITIGSKLDEKFSVEASYIDLGYAYLNPNGITMAQFTKDGFTYVAQEIEADLTNVKYEVDAFLIGGNYIFYSDTTRLGTGNIFLSGGLNIWNSELGTAGYTRYTGNNFNDRVATGNITDSGVDVYYGIGYEWIISNKYNVHLNYMNYDIDGNSSSGLSVGVSILSF